ncbi:MAG: zf-HC2 domain-containing protein [Candidatus Melainabacteria bacterium]|nr:zf-HC2 domain-containing protein [Candidatus Melainabacteria bacterium]
MKCDEARALSTPALDNELTVEQTALFNSHIDVCESCSTAWVGALHIRSGVKDILKSFPATNDLESKIKHNLTLIERESTPIWKNQWLLAAACILPMILVVAFLNFSSDKKLTEQNESVSMDQTQVFINNSALTINDLISKTSHSSETPQADEVDGRFASRSITLDQKSDIGFPLIDTKMVAYELGGAEILQTNDKKIVRMCFKTKDSDLCIDCYQAPTGVIALYQDTAHTPADKVLSTSRIGNVNLVMFSKRGIDVVYASALPQSQLLKLVRSNV